MRQNLPNGPGVCYERNQLGFFEYKNMLTTVNFSIESIKWLYYMNAQEPFRDHIIQHALNIGEKKIQVGGHTYFVDGYAEINEKIFFFEFNGCRYHECYCEVSRKSKFSKKDDSRKERDLSLLGTLIKMRECEWYDLIKRESPDYPLPNFFARKNISESEILKSVADGNFYGLIQVDIFSPDPVIDYFNKLNHPPIFNHVEVEESMLSNQTVEFLKQRKKKFPLSRQLTLTFHAKNYLMTTDLAKYYMSKGMVLSNLKIALEYNKDQPLAPFVNLVTEKRKEATRMRDNNLQNTYKLCMNSCYGKTGLNLDKIRQYKYVNVNKISKNQGPLTQHVTHINGEFETDFVEVVKKKSKIVDSVPGELLCNFVIRTYS